MTISQNLETFHGLPVKDFKQAGDLPDLAGVAPRVRCTFDEKQTLTDFLGLLLAEPGAGEITALVLGLWAENGELYEVTPDKVIAYLVANKNRLPKLEALFVGDITYEENEISWIHNGDLSALWTAFPKLQEFGVRGGNGLSLGRVNHDALKKLTVETGGLPAEVARQALEANAPLEHFELWFGSDDYGLTTGIDDLTELLEGRLFPDLKVLALRNCNFADEIAERLAVSELLERIDHLDLSLGTLQDRGAEALIASGRLGHLKSLDIHHHYLSPEIRQRLAAATPNLIADEAETPDEWDGNKHYYVSVAE
jgi:hypothetical protein